jgi:cysteine desulfurase
LSKNTALVAIMSVNNEIGVVQDIPALVKTTKEFNKNIFFLSDFVQGIGKVPVKSVNNIDAWFVAGHKIGAPKGIACFYLNSDFKINPILFGGGQESGLFPGTSNRVMSTILTKCIASASESLERNNVKYKALRKYLFDKLNQYQIKYQLSVPESFSTPSIISIDFLKAKASHLASALEEKNIFVSTKSACSSFCSEDSHVIKALQIKRNKKISPIRISFSHLNEMAEIDIFVNVLSGILNEK